MGQFAMQPDDYDTLAARVEAEVGAQDPAWHLQILRYERLPPDSGTTGPPPWFRFIASRRHRGGRTTIGPFTVLLEQKSTRELAGEIRSLLDGMWHVGRATRAARAKEAEIDE